jgi:hypothetical protein
VIYFNADTTLGELIASGNTFRVVRLPSGNFRIARQDAHAQGLNFVWHEPLFRCFHGAPKAAAQIDDMCTAILARCPPALQGAMFVG